MTMAQPVDDVPLPEPTETPRIGGADAEVVKKKRTSMQKVSSKMRKSMDKFKRNASLDLSSMNFSEALRKSFSLPRTASSKTSANGRPPITPKTPKSTPTESAKSSTANLVQKQDSFTSAPPTSAAAEKTASPLSPESGKIEVTAAASAPLPSSPVNASAVATASDKAVSEPPASPAPPSMPDAADDAVVIEEEEEEAVEAAAAAPVAPAKKAKGPLRKALKAVIVTALVGGSVTAGVAFTGRSKKSA